MIAFTTRLRQPADIFPQPVGVFEDDDLLLRLAPRSRFTAASCPRAFGLMNSDDLALEVARLVDSETWDF
jgi:hypothetical protein